MCDLKEDLNAEDAEVFAKARREVPYFACLYENLCAPCVKKSYLGRTSKVLTQTLQGRESQQGVASRSDA